MKTAYSAQHTIELSSLAHIDSAKITFGDLTVFIGPQASGKSLVAQVWKLLLDATFIKSHLRTYGYYWKDSPEDFLQIYFGRGYERIWRNDTRLSINGEEVSLQELLAAYRGKAPRERVFYIPAQRVLSLIYGYGWPLPFRGFESTTPFVLSQYSEETRVYLDLEFPNDDDTIFPSEHLPEDLREHFAQHIYPGVRLIVERSLRKRLVLEIQDTQTRLPIDSWGAGQREFTPLMLGLYQLLSPSKKFQKTVKKYDWVVIEEPEMGLHDQSIEGVIQAVFHLLFKGHRVILTTHAERVVEQARETVLRWQNIITEQSQKALGAYLQNRRIRLEKMAGLHKEIRTYLFYLSKKKALVTEIDPVCTSSASLLF